MNNLKHEVLKGIIKENPVFRLVLGTCPSLAITTAVSNSIGMGIAATIVLICSNAVISILRNVISPKIRIPAYITIIAGFVTIVQMLVKAFSPALDEALGVYLPLIAVNCIILGRAEMFASKNNVLASVLDGVGMGLGFTTAIFMISFVRELLGTGSVFGIPVFLGAFDPIIIFILPPGGFFVFGMMMALVNKVSGRYENKKKECADCTSCKGCAR